jgi:hypothetical protein
MRIFTGVLAVGVTVALSLAGAGPPPATAGEVVVIVSAPHHAKVRVIAHDAVLRQGLKAHSGVRIIGPKHPHSLFAPTLRVHPYSHRAHRAGVSRLDKRFTSTGPHPVIAPFRPSQSGLRASDIGLRPSNLSSRPAPSLRGKPVHAKPIHIKIGTPPWHALQGLPAGSRFVLQNR